MGDEELQAIEQALQGHAVQRQSLQSQLAEVESALSELDTDIAYRIIGNIMVKTAPEKIKGKLSERKAVLQRRVESAQKQEEALRAELERRQQEALG